MEKKTPFVIFNLRLAQILLREGHRMVDIKNNREDTTKLVFFFEDTPELQKDFKALQNK